MRTLSLGVLIVCGGTLAALPFRRYQAIPDASSLPGEVTGPVRSSLLQSAADDPSTDLDRFPSIADFPWRDAYATHQEASNASAGWSNQSRRQIDIPLTYEDLLIPIDQPKPILDRFSATVAVRQQQLEENRIAGLVMPPMESLPIETQQELARVAESFAVPRSTFSQDAASARASGRLASSAGGEPARFAGDNSFQTSDRSLSSSPTDAERERFWIRQPN